MKPLLVGITNELGASAVTFSSITNDRMLAVLSGHFELVLQYPENLNIALTLQNDDITV